LPVRQPANRKSHRYWVIKDAQRHPVGVTFYAIWRIGRRTVRVNLRRHEREAKCLAQASVYSFRRDRWDLLIPPLPWEQLALARIDPGRVAQDQGWIRWLYATESQVIEEALVILGHAGDPDEAKRIVKEINEQRRNS
jgi:hypothetical protein